jgi:hypothetical protein
MRRWFKLVASVVLPCSALIGAADGRMIGSWKLKSEKAPRGSGPSLAVGAVMTIRQDASGRFLIMIGGKGPAVQPGPTNIINEVISPDGRTMTETLTGTDPKTNSSYSVVRIWERQ